MLLRLTSWCCAAAAWARSASSAARTQGRAARWAAEQKRVQGLPRPGAVGCMEHVVEVAGAGPLPAAAGTVPHADAIPGAQRAAEPRGSCPATGWCLAQPHAR
jgi:hypothetical protein